MTKCPECFGSRGIARMLHDRDEPRECANPFHSEPEEVEVPEEEPSVSLGPIAVPTPIRQGPVANAGQPVCPYCGTTPCNLLGRQTTMGPYVLMVICCQNEACRKFLGVFPVGQAQPGMRPPGIN